MICDRPIAAPILLAVLWIAGWSQAAGGSHSNGEPDPPDDRLERLEALDPADPVSYFELAEEIADAARDQAGRDLAGHLFALAGLLDPPRLGRSACLALADLEDREPSKQRLLAMAWLLDERGGWLSLGTEDRAPVDPEAALAVAESLGHYRKGQGSRALTTLRTPGAGELLERHGSVLRGGTARFLEDCRLYRGSRKPMLSPQDLTGMLHLERALLAGPDRSWSGELALTRGRPLIEVDPDRLQDTLGVDGSKPYYRNGGWSGGRD
ncbi:MAG: hypothetical protein ACYS0G_04620 [Planctomycetota bacterium]|jgi:hypothetical protein